MGTWGTSLYSGDFAGDLRSTIRAVVRLPYDADRLADIVSEVERGAARNPDDEDHTTFWLVLGDQFARYGLKSDRVVATALEIIDSGRDLARQRTLGQSDAGVEKRRRMLAELRDRLTKPPKPAARRLIKAPEPYLFDVGELVAYPTCGGASRNPYSADPQRLKTYGPRGGEIWTQDGWGAAAIVERGRAFDYIAWYRPIVVRTGFLEHPSIAILQDAEWLLKLPGTCSRSHHRRIAFDRVGEVSVSLEKLKARLPAGRRWGSGVPNAISDISIANRLAVTHPGAAPRPGQLVERDDIVRLSDVTPTA